MKNELKKSVWLLLTGMLLAGCAQAPDVTTYVDPLTNQRTELLSENELVLKGVEHPREVVWLNASRIPVSRNKYNIYLEVQYAVNEQAGPLDIYPGATLTIIADGKELKFSGLGSMNERKPRNGILYETAHYEAKQSDIETIANAKKVTVLIRGKSLLIEREFGPENFERFKKFLANISALPPRAGTPTAKPFSSY